MGGAVQEESAGQSTGRHQRLSLRSGRLIMVVIAPGRSCERLRVERAAVFSDLLPCALQGLVVQSEMDVIQIPFFWSS